MSAILKANPNCCQPYYASIGELDNNTVYVKFASALDWQIAQSALDFNISLSGGAVTIVSVTISGSINDTGQLSIVLSRQINVGETGTISYIKGGNGEDLIDMQGNEIGIFTVAITNLRT